MNTSINFAYIIKHILRIADSLDFNFLLKFLHFNSPLFQALCQDDLDFPQFWRKRVWRSVCVCVGEGLHGLAGMACLVVLLKQKHSRGFKNYQMVVLSLSESALLQPCVSEL